MVKVVMDKDERYPVPYIYDDEDASEWGIVVDIPQPLLDRWYKIDSEWNSARIDLLDLMEDSISKKKLEDAKQGIQPKGWTID